MTDIITKDKATIEMKKWSARWNIENSENNNERYALQSKIKKNKIDIATATIGFGKAITIMTDEVDRLNNEIGNIPIKNQSGEFMEKFGKDYYKLDWS